MKKIKLDNKLILKKEIIHLHLVKGGITDPNDEVETDSCDGNCTKSTVIVREFDRIASIIAGC